MIFLLNVPQATDDCCYHSLHLLKTNKNNLSMHKLMATWSIVISYLYDLCGFQP